MLCHTTPIRISTWNQWLSWVEGRWPSVLSRVDRCIKGDYWFRWSRTIVGNKLNVRASGIALNWPSITGYPHVWVSKTAWCGASKYWWAQIQEVRLVRLLSWRKQGNYVRLSRTLREIDMKTRPTPPCALTVVMVVSRKHTTSYLIRLWQYAYLVILVLVSSMTSKLPIWTSQMAWARLNPRPSWMF